MYVSAGDLNIYLKSGEPHEGPEPMRHIRIFLPFVLLLYISTYIIIIIIIILHNYNYIINIVVVNIYIIQDSILKPL
jgi:hypothetical protein